jgi:integrase
MRVLLKGIHKVQSKGQTYYYAYRGGPRIKAKPGTPAFLQEYQDAHKGRQAPAKETLFNLISEFKSSSDFSGLAERTRKDLRKYLRAVEDKFGSMPLKAAEDPKARGVFKSWRDTFKDTPRKADHLFAALQRVLSFGVDRGQISRNVCENGGKLYKAHRQEKIWTQDHISRLLKVANYELRLAFVLALWTGQRQGDLLKASWTNYKDGKLKLFQSKGNKWITIPVGATLQEWLDEAPKRAATILTGQKGHSWSSSGFQTEWRKACIKAAIRDVTFHDIRGTAVTRLALAGATVPEIASITGHSLKDVQEILDRHYLGGRLELAESAMRKLEANEQRT